MKKQTIHSRRVRYGSMTISLTVTLIAAVVMINAMFSSLASHFSWYLDMTEEKVYTVSDRCVALLTEEIAEANAKAKAEGGEPVRAEIIFCDDYRKYDVGSTGSYIYNTAHELALAFPDTIEISWFNCWVEKKRADELGVKASTNVVLKLSNGKSRVFSQTDFFTFAGNDTSNTIGYNGEKIFATTLVSLMNEERPVACLTINHDEVFYDYQIIYLLRDAGYDVMMFDLYYNEIPEECDLLVCYNPNADFIIADGISERSEITKVEKFLDGGNKMMVFFSSTTPQLSNLEGLLNEWGIDVERTTDPATGLIYNCLVKDAGASLTSDGFTILGEYTSGRGGEIMSKLQNTEYVPKIIFKDTTAIKAADGYTGADGSYTKGDRTMTALFTSSANAQAWANGATVPGTSGKLPLMTLTEDEKSGGQVLACASIEYATQDYMQSAVFGNNDALLASLEAMGKENVLVGLRYKPFTSMTISSITTTQMRDWTLWLALTPAVIVLGCAIIVLVRRKYA